MAAQMQVFEGEFICGVCLEFFDTPVMLSCGHNFCKKCIQGIVNNNNRDSFRSLSFLLLSLQCPLCQSRQDFRHLTVDQLPVNRVLESLIDLYKKQSPTDIFDLAWNLDMPVNYIQCQQHKLPQERYCDPCGVAICRQCEVLHHEDSKRKSKHRVKDLKDVAHQCQADIASILNEIKKKSLYLNEQIHLQADVLTGVQENQVQVDKELDQACSRLMSVIRQKQDALRRNVSSELARLKDPIENEQRKLKKLRTMVQELMKGLANIKRNKDMTHQIKKMKDMKKQLHSLLCFDFAWNLSEKGIHTIDLPHWSLIGLKETEAAIQGLHWKGNTSAGPKPKCVETGCQTDFRDSATETIYKLKSTENPDPVQGQVQTAMIYSSTMSVNGTPHPSIMENKMSDQSSAAITASGETRSLFTFSMPLPAASEVPASSFTNSFLIPKNSSKNVPVTENMASAASNTAEQLGNQTRVAFPTAAIQNGIPAAKTLDFSSAAATQDGIPAAKTPGFTLTSARQDGIPATKPQGFTPMAAKQDDIPAAKTQGFTPTAKTQGGIPKAATPVGLSTTSSGLPTGGVPSVTVPSGLPTTGLPLTSGGLPTTIRPGGLLIAVTPSSLPTTPTSIGFPLAEVSSGLPTTATPATATPDGLLTCVTLSNSPTAAMPGKLRTTAAPVVLPTSAIPVDLPTASEPFAVASERPLTDISSQSNTYNSDIGTIASTLNALKIPACTPQQIKESKNGIPQRSPPFTFESYQKEKETSEIDDIEDERLEDSPLKTLPSLPKQTNKALTARSESNSGSSSTSSLTSNQINGSVSADNGIMVSNASIYVATGTTAGGASSNYVETNPTTLVYKSLDSGKNIQSLVAESGQEVTAADAPVSVPNICSTFPSETDKKGATTSSESLVTIGNKTIDNGFKALAVSSDLGKHTGQNSPSTLSGTSLILSTQSDQSSAKPSKPETSSLWNQTGQNSCKTSGDTSLIDKQIAQQVATSSPLNLHQSGQNNFVASAETSSASDNEIRQNGVTSPFASLNESDNQSGQRNPASSESRESNKPKHQSSLEMGKGNERTFLKQPISANLNFFSEDEGSLQGRKILRANRKQKNIKQQ